MIRHRYTSKSILLCRGEDGNRETEPQLETRTVSPLIEPLMPLMNYVPAINRLANFVSCEARLSTAVLERHSWTQTACRASVHI